MRRHAYTGAVPTERPRVFTDLDLNGTVPARALPGIGEWGPTAVVSTRAKRRARWFAIVAFVVALGAVVGMGALVFHLVMG